MPSVPQSLGASALAPLCLMLRVLVPSVLSCPWCPQCTHPRCFSDLEPQCFGTLSAQTFHALVPSVPLVPSVHTPSVLTASVPSVHHRIGVLAPSVLRCSVPSVLAALTPPVFSTQIETSSMAKFHAYKSCQAKLPSEDKLSFCVRCLGMQHASSALGDEMFCSICAAFQPWVLHRRLDKFTGATCPANTAESYAALGASPSPSSICP
ncbi:UNVERIFIED_CONTAM: hypothetical protein FKN15_020971 [Acipenser sinensis]